MKNSLRRSAWTGLVCLLLGTLVFAGQRNARDTKDTKDQDKNDTRRPKLTLKAQPPVTVTNGRVVLTAELVGGADDYEEFFCPTTEWDWDDGTTSESTLDCQPFEAGKSQIKRRFTVDHRFRRAGQVKVAFRLKRADKILVTASTNIQVSQGLGGN